jgi:ketosteroid isomerase-like protein
MAQKSVEIARRFIDHLNAGEFVWAEIDPEIVWVVSPLLLLAGTYFGHGGLRILLRHINELFDQARYEVDDLIDAGESVVALGRFRWRAAQSGMTGARPIAMVLRLRDGRVAAFRAYFHPEHAFEAARLRG